MSRVASSNSSNSSNASDGASTTGSSTGSVASDASSVATAASAASGASGTSTAPSSVNSANPDTSAAAGESDSGLEKWYNDQIKSTEIKKFLQASQNPTVPSKGLKATVEEWLEDSHEGVWKTENGTEIIGFDTSKARAGKKVYKIGGQTITCEWGPAAQGADTSIQFVDATNLPASDTATKTQKTMPALDPFLKLPKPTVPPDTELFKSYDAQTAEMGPPMAIEDWDTCYPVIERYKHEEFGRQQCYDFDMNDKVILEALRKAKIDAGLASNFALVEKSSHCLSKAGKVPSAMASSVLNNAYKKKLMHEDEREIFRKALEEGFTGLLSHPELPVTDDGFCTYRWASTLIGGGKVKGVDATTALGRHMMMRQVRADIWNETEASYNAATDAASKVTDWYHEKRNHKKGTGVVLRDLKDYAIDTVKTGAKLPKDCPQSILDMAKDRDEMNKRERNNPFKSPTRSAYVSSDRPRPTAVPAHQAVMSEPNPLQTDREKGTNGPLTDTTKARLESMRKTLSTEDVQRVQGFFNQFPPKSA